MEENEGKININFSQSSPFLSEELIESDSSFDRAGYSDILKILAKDTFILKKVDFKILPTKGIGNEHPFGYLNSAYTEFITMKKNLPQVVRTHQYRFNEKNNIFSYTMDYMKKSDLGSLVRKGGLSYDKCYQLFKDVTTGLQEKVKKI